MRLNITGSLVALSALTLIASPTQALAWGNQGHETVGAIADKIVDISPAAKSVKALLDGETLSSVSTWADCVKHPQLAYCTSQTQAVKEEWAAFAAKVGKANASSYHYADTDINSQGYAYVATVTQEDVVHGIQEAIAALQGAPKGPSNPFGLTSREGLWLLTHLVGDIHQPLHVGVEAVDGDLGASQGSNKFFPNNSTCLHSQWDDKFVVDTMKADVNGAGRSKGPAKGKAAKAYSVTPSQYASYLEAHGGAVAATNGAIDEWPIAWATESMEVARDKALHSVTIDKKGTGTCGFGKMVGWSVTLPAKYESNVAEPTIDDQIWKAGNRLAAILTSIQWPKN